MEYILELNVAGRVIGAFKKNMASYINAKWIGSTKTEADVRIITGSERKNPIVKCSKTTYDKYKYYIMRYRIYNETDKCLNKKYKN